MPEQASLIEKIWPFPELVKSLGVSMAMLYQWRDEGLPAFRFGRSSAVYEDDLIVFLREMGARNAEQRKAKLKQRGSKGEQ